MATAAPGPRLYRSRRPERTLLYRALADQFERFLGVYEERFEPTHGFLRRSVAPAVYRYLDCGSYPAARGGPSSSTLRPGSTARRSSPARSASSRPPASSWAGIRIFTSC